MFWNDVNEVKEEIENEGLEQFVKDNPLEDTNQVIITLRLK